MPWPSATERRQIVNNAYQQRDSRRREFLCQVNADLAAQKQSVMRMQLDARTELDAKHMAALGPKAPPTPFQAVTEMLAANTEPNTLSNKIAECAAASRWKLVAAVDVRSLVNCINKHIKLSNLVVQVVSALHIICAGHPGNVEHLLAEEGLPAVVRAMRDFPDQMDIQLVCCKLLLLLGQNGRCTSQLLQLNVLGLVESALHKHGARCPALSGIALSASSILLPLKVPPILPRHYKKPFHQAYTEALHTSQPLPVHPLTAQPMPMAKFAASCASSALELARHAARARQSSFGQLAQATLSALPPSKYKGTRDMNGVIEACRMMDHSAMSLSVTYPLAKRGMSRGARSMPGVRATISDIQFADERHKCPFASLSNAVQMATSSEQNAATLKKMRCTRWPFSKTSCLTHEQFLKVPLPARLGGTPTTSSSLPFVQKSAQAPDDVYQWLVQQVRALPQFDGKLLAIKPSNLDSFKATVDGFHLIRQNNSQDVTFFGSGEFGFLNTAHIPGSEMWKGNQGGGQGSFVVVVSPSDGQEIVAKKRGEWHLLAGSNSGMGSKVVPQTTILAYAPRSLKEAQYSLEIAKASIAFVLKTCFNMEVLSNGETRLAS